MNGHNITKPFNNYKIMLLEKIIESNKIYAYFRSGLVKDLFSL